MEDQLRAALLALRDELPQKAAERIAQLEDVHGKRRGWIWAELGQARLAGALRHLFELARATRHPLGGVSPDAFADAYRRHGWQADDALLRVLASVSDYADEQAVQAAAVQGGVAGRVELRLERVLEARARGYVGDSCDECGNFTMVRNGTCLKCTTCGATNGCS